MVFGRKREAITTLWFLSELIVSDDDEKREVGEEEETRRASFREMVQVLI